MVNSLRLVDSPNHPVLQLLVAQTTRDINDFAVHLQNFLRDVLRGFGFLRGVLASLGFLGVLGFLQFLRFLLRGFGFVGVLGRFGF